MLVAKIEAVATKDIVAFYNANATKGGEKAVSKFADRKTAERRVEILLNKIDAFDVVPASWMPAPEGFEGETQDTDLIEEEANEEPASPPSAFGSFMTQQAAAAAVHSAANPAPRTTGDDSKASNSKGVADSWTDADVRAARLTRDGVSVVTPEGEKKSYTSCYNAFRDLRLPNSKHIRFRMKLKEAARDGKTATFEHNDQKYVFSIEKIEPAEVLLANVKADKKVKA